MKPKVRGLLVIVISGGFIYAGYRVQTRIDLVAAIAAVDLWRFLLSACVFAAAILAQGFLWHRLLKSCGINIGPLVAMRSRALPIFAKYIPGKLWGPLATAAYISAPAGTIRAGFAIAIWFEGCIVVGGVLVACAGIVLHGAPTQRTLLTLLAILFGVALLIAVIAIPCFRRRIEYLIARLVGTKLVVGAPSFVNLSLWNAAVWIIIGYAHWEMIRAMGHDVGYSPIFFQALANISGMMMALAPGGLGVREAVMIGYLGMSGMGLELALLVATVARCWAILAEFFVFLVGLVLLRLEAVLLAKRRNQ